MMTLRDLINKLLGRETASANTARERLQLVLAHDRVDMSSLTTDLLDKMRKEIPVSYTHLTLPTTPYV